jgi:hypothetical protein
MSHRHLTPDARYVIPSGRWNRVKRSFSSGDLCRTVLVSLSVLESFEPEADDLGGEADGEGFGDLCPTRQRRYQTVQGLTSRTAVLIILLKSSTKEKEGSYGDRELQRP